MRSVKEIIKVPYSKLNSIKKAYNDIFKTKLIKGSKIKFFTNRFFSYFSIFTKCPGLYNKIKHLKGDFIISNEEGVFFGYFNDDSLDIYSPYFEYYIQHWFNYDNKKSIFLDIGANRGKYSIKAINVLGYKKVIAFEPLSKNIYIFKKNIKLNNLSDKITIYPYGLSDIEGVLNIYYQNSNTGISSIEKKIGKRESIKVKKLDNIIKRINIIKNISFIKIDVEGHEYMVLKGGIEFFKNLNKNTCLMIEIWGNNKFKNKCLNLLERLNFKKIEKIGDNYLFIKV